MALSPDNIAPHKQCRLAGSSTPAEVLAYATDAATVARLQLSAAELDEVTEQLMRLLELMDVVAAFPLPTDVEVAEVFRP